LLKGNIYAAQQKTQKARAAYEALIQDHPENPAALFRLGNLFIMDKKPDKALTIYDKALAINPNLMDVFINMIRLYSAEKEYQTALDRCDAHLEAMQAPSPVVVSIIQGLRGNLFTALGKPDAAKQAFELSIQSNPQFTQPYLSLARIYSQEQNEEKELEIYQNLLAQQPEQIEPHFQLGVFYEKKGKNELAKAHYKKVLELNPEYIPALNNLAFFYAEQDIEMNKALDMARKAKELSGEVSAIMDTLGWIYYKKKLYDSAIQEFSNCVEKEPENPIFNFHLGLAYNKKEDYTNAKKYLKKALELQKDFKGADEARKMLNQI
jgi:tetratricopeptide (TPR) repeat protein